MSNFDLFRTKMSNEASCRRKFETSFITEGAAPIVIHIVRLDKDRDATMVFTDAEGPDAAIVFTPKQEKNINNLLKTDYYIWEDKMFFVYEDVLIPRDVNYIKQKSYQCNVQVKPIQDDFKECGGYFISSLRKYIDTEFQQKLNVSDKEQPIVILPMQSWIVIGTKVEIGGKPWKIIDYDAITNAGIAYVSLERDFFQKNNDSVVAETEVEISTLASGVQYSFDTQDGYFNTSSPLTIISRSANKVIFEIPYGISDVTIETKHNDVIITESYKVVI